MIEQEMERRGCWKGTDNKRRTLRKKKDADTCNLRSCDPVSMVVEHYRLSIGFRNLPEPTPEYLSPSQDGRLRDDAPMKYHHLAGFILLILHNRSL